MNMTESEEEQRLVWCQIMLQRTLVNAHLLTWFFVKRSHKVLFPSLTLILGLSLNELTTL